MQKQGGAVDFASIIVDQPLEVPYATGASVTRVAGRSRPRGPFLAGGKVKKDAGESKDGSEDNDDEDDSSSSDVPVEPMIKPEELLDETDVIRGVGDLPKARRTARPTAVNLRPGENLADQALLEALDCR